MSFEEKIIFNQDHYQQIFQNITSGYSLNRVITNENNEPIDFVFKDINPAFEKLTGLKKSEIINKRVSEVLPNIEDYWINTLGMVAVSGKPIEYTNYVSELNKYFEAKAFSLQNDYFAVTFDEVTNKLKTELKLKDSEEQLKTIFHNSNALSLLVDHKFRIIRINAKSLFASNLTIDDVGGMLPGDAMNCYHAKSENKGCGHSANCNSCNIKNMVNETFQQKSSLAEKEIRHSFIQNDQKIKKDYNISTAYINSLKKPLVLVNLHDINYQKSIERQLEAHQFELKEKNEEYEAVNEELRQTNEELFDVNEKILESEEKFKSLFNHAQVAIFRTQIQSGKLLECNKKFATILGYSSVEECRQSYTPEKHYANINDREIIKSLLQKKGEFNKVILDARTKSGDHIWIKYSGKAFEKEGYIEGGMTDITMLKNTQQELEINQKFLQQKNLEYETINEKLRNAIEELHHKNKEIEEARKQAEESDNLKTAFLANMSHEIRTPLNGVIGFIDLLRTGLDESKFESYTKIIKQSSNQLINIINNILDLSKIEAGVEVIYREEFQILDLLHTLKHEFSNKLNNREIALNLTNNSDDIILNTDKTKLYQILNNLLSNAIKFTEKGEVNFGYKIKGNLLEFFVSDTGIGIDSNDQSVIFDQFRQLDNTATRKFGGTGIGLALVKSYVELLGGSIRIDSTLDIGTTFYFTLPGITVEEKTCNHANVETIKAEWCGKHILIVDDDFICRELLCEVLTEHSPVLLTAEDGYQALELVRQYPSIDLILLDIKMPNLNGYETIKEIKRINKNIPVIAQTAFAFKHDQEKIEKAGFDAFLTKPVDHKKLIKIVNHYLSEKT